MRHTRGICVIHHVNVVQINGGISHGHPEHGNGGDEGENVLGGNTRPECPHILPLHEQLIEL